MRWWTQTDSLGTQTWVPCGSWLRPAAAAHPELRPQTSESSRAEVASGNRGTRRAGRGLQVRAAVLVLAGAQQAPKR